MRTFNITGRCRPNEHYMVDIEDKLREIKKYVDNGAYFVINRARQYGKTTTLGMLAEYLQGEYMVISLDFQMMSQGDFRDETAFSEAFADMLLAEVDYQRLVGNETIVQAFEDLRKAEEDGKLSGLRKLFKYLSKICRECSKQVVLMIDEVDSASNNQVFLDFLAQLREYYLARNEKPTFQSVILAGVYDVKNLKLKIRPDSEHKFNSPWNIAEPFVVDMSFSAAKIAGMLEEYEKDNHTGMNVEETAQCIYDYTSGYPFLVSAICKTVDTAMRASESAGNENCGWNKKGVAEAVKTILKERSTLFDSLTKQLAEHDDLREMLKLILFQGSRFTFNPLNTDIGLAEMLGYIKEDNGTVAVSNRIFEMCMYNLFLSEEELTNATYKEAQREKNQFIVGNTLNMDLVMRKFANHYTEVYGQMDEAFVEKQGRKLFLLYLKPIINGTGNYYVEAQTRDLQRTDIIVDYLGQQFVVELKIWHGEKYNEKGEIQLAEYLDKYQLKKGYLLTFNFNKNKTIGVKEVIVNDKTIVET